MYKCYIVDHSTVLKFCFPRESLPGLPPPAFFSPRDGCPWETPVSPQANPRGLRVKDSSAARSRESRRSQECSFYMYLKIVGKILKEIKLF